LPAKVNKISGMAITRKEKNCVPVPVVPVVPIKIMGHITPFI
jgi:hypothetical protein